MKKLVKISVLALLMSVGVSAIADTNVSLNKKQIQERRTNMTDKQKSRLENKRSSMTDEQKSNMKERISNMTPEQKKHFKHKNQGNYS